MKLVNIKKTIYLVMLMIIINILTFKNVIADNRITINLNGSRAVPFTLFDGKDPLLIPGTSIKKEFLIINDTSRKYVFTNMAFALNKIERKNAGLNKEDAKSVFKFIKCRVEYSNYNGNNVVFEDSIDKIFDTPLDFKNNPVEINTSKLFTITIAMDDKADNSLQGVNFNFDIVLNAKDDSSTDIIPTPPNNDIQTPGNSSILSTSIEPSIKVVLATPLTPSTSVNANVPSISVNPNVPSNTVTQSTPTDANTPGDKTQIGAIGNLVKTGRMIDTKVLMLIGVFTFFLGGSSIIFDVIRKKR